MVSRALAAGLLSGGLVAFACSSPDVRPAVDTESPGAGGAGGGGGSSAPVTSEDAGGEDAGTDDGATATCTNVSCANGCCDSNHVCQTIASSAGCPVNGLNGAACQTCTAPTTCTQVGTLWSCE